MNILVCPDKFKSSLSGEEIRDVCSEILHKRAFSVESVLLSDGGDGLLTVFQDADDYDFIEVPVQDPLGRTIRAKYLFCESKEKAIIEMAEASGLKLLEKNEQNPLYTNTFGLGQLIRYAMEKGAKHILVGIGGSATNDCGGGMAAALGYAFFDENEKEILPNGGNLQKIKRIDDTQVSKLLKEVEIRVACDVHNPLYGIDGAAHIYAAQKGATEEEIQFLDEGLRQFAEVIRKWNGSLFHTVPGAGAAGGVGAGFMAFCGAELEAGTSIVFDAIHFKDRLKSKDWILFAEGKVDEQSFMGKPLGEIVKLNRRNSKIGILCGLCELDEERLKAQNIYIVAELLKIAEDEADSFRNAKKYLRRALEDYPFH